MAKKKKEEDIKSLNASVKYEGEGELISDISSRKPLQKKEIKKKKAKKSTKKAEKTKLKESVDIEKIEKTEKTEKDILNELLQSDTYFYLKYGGIIIYDSIKNKESVIFVQNNGFNIDGINYIYSGLSIKFKK